MMPDSHRKEAMQRIQIGLTGLAGVVLLVGLANIVIQKAGVDDDVAATAADGAPPQLVVTDNTVATAPDSAPSPAPEPLAELGVTPPQPEKATAPEQDKNVPGQVVPDLKPNPALKKPMDREP
ncbi:hypothetical protein [Rhizorhapis sp. SPR117]|uniref:hypothetical protein n=1 Tax=Rhizorhapis sp. SPR117 TaxID=2912611 RepID=UPI001F2DF1FC|nr:hypothetical protein [Rhizorhapis sp. SPR117]